MTSRDSSGNGFGDLEGMESDMKGWSGDIGGREGFPHHEVSRSEYRERMRRLGKVIRVGRAWRLEQRYA